MAMEVEEEVDLNTLLVIENSSKLELKPSPKIVKKISRGREV